MNVKVKETLQKYSIAVFLVALFLVCVLFVPRFRTVNNLINITTQIAVNGLMATGMAFVILTGGIDLSVGSVAGLTGIVVSAIVLQMPNISIGGSVAVIVAAALVMGTLVGLFAGFFINILHVPPFIATLAVSNITRGLAFVYTESKPIYGMSSNFKWLGLERIGMIPVILIVLILVLVASHFYLTKTCGGRYIFAVGSNEDVATLCGINKNKSKYTVYIVCGILAALAGGCYASKLQCGQPSACDGYELNAIAAVAMGGTSMAGGKGGIIQTAFGIMIIGIINNALNLLGVSSYWQKVVLGVIILIAVVSDTAKGMKE